MKSLFLKIQYYFEKNIGKILTLFGILLLIAGLLFLSILPSITSILSFFFGIIFTFIGILVHMEIITYNSSKVEKVGAILIIITIILFAGSFASFLYRDIERISIVVPFGLKVKSEGGFRIFELRIVEFKYPLLWLSKWLLIAGLISLAAGVFLKTR